MNGQGSSQLKLVWKGGGVPLGLFLKSPPAPPPAPTSLGGGGEECDGCAADVGNSPYRTVSPGDAAPKRLLPQEPGGCLRPRDRGVNLLHKGRWMNPEEGIPYLSDLLLGFPTFGVTWGFEIPQTH